MECNIEYIFECRVRFQSGSTGPIIHEKFFAPDDTRSRRHVKRVLIPKIKREARRGKENASAIFGTKLFRSIGLNGN